MSDAKLVAVAAVSIIGAVGTVFLLRQVGLFATQPPQPVTLARVANTDGSGFGLNFFAEDHKPVSPTAPTLL